MLLLATNDFFLGHHEQGRKGSDVLMLKGAKRVPPAKEGHDLALTKDIAFSQLLTLQIIFTGMHSQFIIFLFNIV